MCTGEKNTYETREAANIEAKHLSKRRSKRFTSYKCEICQKWHLTSNKKKILSSDTRKNGHRNQQRLLNFLNQITI